MGRHTQSASRDAQHGCVVYHQGLIRNLAATWMLLLLALVSLLAHSYLRSKSKAWNSMHTRGLQKVNDKMWHCEETMPAFQKIYIKMSIFSFHFSELFEGSLCNMHTKCCRRIHIIQSSPEHSQSTCSVAGTVGATWGSEVSQVCMSGHLSSTQWLRNPRSLPTLGWSSRVVNFVETHSR